MRYLAILGCLFVTASLCGQDAYFTQFYAAPTELNPALTGAIDGSYRVSAIYRDQWNGIIDNPYQTYGVFGDMRFELGGSRTGPKDYVGIGLGFTADRVSVFDFNTTGIRVSAAFHKQLDPTMAHFISGGLYMGLIQRNVNIESLTFHDQFNGLDGYTFSTTENLPENNFAHGDLGIGLNYTIAPSDNLRLSAGGALIHIVQPSVSFYSRSLGFDNVPDIDLYQKITAYVSAEVALNKRAALLPRVALVTQGPHRIFSAGAHVKFEINDYNTNSVHLGAGVRMSRNLGALEPSAITVLAGYELHNLLIGMSYDWHLDDLINEKDGQGIFELSITYIGEYENAATFCPTF